MKEHNLALVTGGGQGIGKAICRALLDGGYQVVFLDLNQQRAEEFLLQENSDDLHFYPCDVSDPTRVRDVCRHVLERLGTVSVLVNNAGIQTHVPFLEMSEEVWHRTISVDLDSMFYVSRALAPAMVEQGYGRIVNMSSMSALRGSSRHVHYNTAKSGVLGFTRGLSYELAPHGVTVNAICPGTVDTEIIQDYIEAKRDSWLSQMHVKRLGTPEDIANAVMFLVSPATGWVTGQALHVNGGILTP